jgi:hypothetical protein
MNSPPYPELPGCLLDNEHSGVVFASSVYAARQVISQFPEPHCVLTDAKSEGKSEAWTKMNLK